MLYYMLSFLAFVFPHLLSRSNYDWHATYHTHTLSSLHVNTLTSHISLPYIIRFTYCVDLLFFFFSLSFYLFETLTLTHA